MSTFAGNKQLELAHRAKKKKKSMVAVNFLQQLIFGRQEHRQLRLNWTCKPEILNEAMR